MIWVLSIGGGIVALFGLFILWGILHIRQSAQKAVAETRLIELADIEPLARECIEVFQRELRIHLDLDNCDDSAQKLDDVFRDGTRLKATFQQDDFYWRFAKPIGACLGELLHRHAKYEWRKTPGEAPSMEFVLKDGSSKVFPFDKVIKQAQVGDPGDIVAYVSMARSIDQVAEQMRQQ